MRRSNSRGSISSMDTLDPDATCEIMPRRTKSPEHLPRSASAQELIKLEGGLPVSSAHEQYRKLVEHSADERDERGRLFFAPLSKGRTRFALAGPPIDESAGLVICIHGLTCASYVWSDLATELAARRYHVLTFDLYGRGKSSCRKARHSAADNGSQPADCDADFFVEQLVELLQVA